MLRGARTCCACGVLCRNGRVEVYMNIVCCSAAGCVVVWYITPRRAELYGAVVYGIVVGCGVVRCSAQCCDVIRCAVL